MTPGETSLYMCVLPNASSARCVQLPLSRLRIISEGERKKKEKKRSFLLFIVFRPFVFFFLLSSLPYVTFRSCHGVFCLARSPISKFAAPLWWKPFFYSLLSTKEMQRCTPPLSFLSFLFSLSSALSPFFFSL